MTENILAIDTSGSRAFVSVGNGSKTSSRSPLSDDSHNEELAVLVEASLGDLGLLPSSLHRVLLGIGPGSFTGLRIGLAFAKGLCQALSLPLLTISSLKLVASCVGKKTNSEFCGAIFDARRGEVFCSLYESSTLVELVEPGIRTLSEFSTLLSMHTNKISSRVVIGSWNVTGIQDAFTCVQPEGLGEEAIRLYQEYPGFFAASSADAFSLSSVEPAYLRAVSAQTISERVQTANMKEKSA